MTASLTYYKFSLPLKTPFTTSFGTDTNRVAYIFHLNANGIDAFSESVANVGPFYSYEDNETIFHIVKQYLADMVRDLPQPEEFLRRAERIRGHNMAKATMEMLLWDYHAKVAQKPMHLAVGKSKGYADVGISIGMETPEKMVNSISAALEKGYKRIKVKIEKSKELSILTAIRDVYPEIPLSVDANTDYTLKDMETLKKIDRFNLVYMEQPLDHDDLVDHATLSKNISTPICLDESITSPDRARKAFEIGAGEIINIKPGRVAGFTNSMEIAKITRENGGHVWIGGMLETGIGRAYNVAIASSVLIDYPGDTSPNEKYFERDLVRNPFTMSNGIIKPNQGPGIGVDVDLEYLKKVSVDSGKLF